MLLPGKAFGAARGAYPWPLGVQLYSVRAELDQDFALTLRRLAALGFTRCESAGWHGRTPAAFAAAVQAAGLRCDSAHATMPDIHADPAATIGAARDAGCDYLICSSPLASRPLGGGDWVRSIIAAMTLDDWKRNADLLETYGRKASAAGIGFGYHNHPAEFARYQGRRGWDVIVGGTDAATVKLEIDVGWAAAGGEDVPRLLHAHHGRVVRLHLKDVPRLPSPGELATSFDTVEVGRGRINWRAVIAAARANAVGGAYIEQEGPYRRPVFQSLAISRDALIAGN